jgi:hypothetical protein
MTAALSAAIAVLGIAIIRAIVWLLWRALPVNRFTVALFRERHFAGPPAG